MSKFQTNKICGSVLCSLNEADMKELGLMVLGDRRRLQSFVKKELTNPTACISWKQPGAPHACVTRTVYNYFTHTGY